MEEIIIKRPFYKVVDTVLKNKLILYNKENQILILKDGKFIRLPKEMIYNCKEDNDSLFAIRKDKMMDIVRIYDYYSRLTSVNNKLTKASREIINEYYAYNIDFVPDIFDKLNIKDKKEILPSLISIEKFLKLNKFIANMEDKTAVKILQKKLEHKGE